MMQGVDTRGLRFLLIDAEELVLGRLAAQISTILQVPAPASHPIHLCQHCAKTCPYHQRRLLFGSPWTDAQGFSCAQGKSKPSYCQNRDMGDVCVVVNAEKVHLSGKKLDQMVYRWHTG
jgi:ribosomal protein L13